MGKTLLGAFRDGVLAIILTIMVLELKVPHGASLQPLWGVFLSYILSFVYVGIYWNNHHHLRHTVRTVSGGVLWASLHLLFWLSLVIYAIAIAVACVAPPIAGTLYAIVAIAWLIPDRRIERFLAPETR
jgi:uncharacterized membrane protein